MQMLLDAGYPKEDMHHHESDLYIYDMPLTRKVLSEYCEKIGCLNLKSCIENGVGDGFVVEPFTDNITGKRMWDCFMQYKEEIL